MRDERYGRSLPAKQFVNPVYFGGSNKQASFIDLKFDEDRTLVIEYRANLASTDLSVPLALPYGEVQLFYFEGNAEMTVTLPLYPWLARRVVTTRRLRAIVYLFPATLSPAQPAGQDLVVYCGCSESNGESDDETALETRQTMTSAIIQPGYLGLITQIQLLTAPANPAPLWLHFFNGFSPVAGNHPSMVIGTGATSMNPVQVRFSVNQWMYWALSAAPDVYAAPSVIAASNATVPFNIINGF